MPRSKIRGSLSDEPFSSFEKIIFTPQSHSLKLVKEALKYYQLKGTKIYEGNLVYTHGILRKQEDWKTEQIESAFLIIVYAKREIKGQLFDEFFYTLQSFFLLSDESKINELWKFFKNNGGPLFKEYLGRRGVTESQVENVIKILVSLSNHTSDKVNYTLNEVKIALESLKRMGYDKLNDKIITNASRATMSHDMSKYTVEHIKIALEIQIWSKVMIPNSIIRKCQARIKFERYPDMITTREFKENLKELIATHGSEAYDANYRGTISPKIREIDEAINPIYAARTTSKNQEVKVAIFVLKSVHIGPASSDIQLARGLLDNFRRYHSEQIKNAISILEWGKASIPSKLEVEAEKWIKLIEHPDEIKEVDEVLDILEAEWKSFIRINDIAEKLHVFAHRINQMNVDEKLKSRKYLRDLKWFESREQMWRSVSKLKSKVVDMLKLGIFNVDDMNHIQNYLTQLKVDEAKVIYETGVELNDEIANKEPLLVRWKEVERITQEIIQWSIAFIAVDQQLRDLIKRKSNKHTRGF